MSSFIKKEQICLDKIQGNFAYRMFFMKSNLTLSFPLLSLLLMFPQLVETIYSPALTSIASDFDVTAEMASQTLSCYFIAFAIGIVVWGRLCDVLGRRPVILSGLIIYGLASCLALFCSEFWVLIVARMLSAFGAAVGSIGAMTVLRDKYDAEKLTHIFSIMGIILAVSPAIGVLTGSVLVNKFDYYGVFIGLIVLAVVLIGFTFIRLPETKPKNIHITPLKQAFAVMLKDCDIWHSALFVALFNVSLFSYYQTAAFMFDYMNISTTMFGFTGVVISLGVGIGALVNRYCASHQWSFQECMFLAISLHVVASFGVYQLQTTFWLLIPMMIIVMSYGIAIPNILARALRNYSDYIGTSGAILGLMYDVLLGLGLVLTGMKQNLGLTLSLVSVLIILTYSHFLLVQQKQRTNIVA